MKTGCCKQDSKIGVMCSNMKKHVVIIEDDEDMLDVLTETVSKAGYRATGLRQMNSVEELLALGADCFIIDEKLPVVNGHIICIILRSKPENRDVPVLLISGDDKLEHVASLCEANGYLSKPFDVFSDLPAQLDKLVA